MDGDGNYYAVAQYQGLGDSPAEVEDLLFQAALLDAGDLPRFDRVVEAMEREKPEAPELTVPEVEIAAYDELTPTTREEVGG